MKQYSHDYSLVSKAESLLHDVWQALATDNKDDAQKMVENARSLLQQYTSQDNMVEDNDCYGWVKASDTFNDEQLDFIRDLFGEQLTNCPTSTTAAEELDIINVCQRNLDCPDFESVAQFLDNKSGKWTEIEP